MFLLLLLPYEVNICYIKHTCIWAISWWSDFNIRYNSFLTSCSRAPNIEWVPIFLVHSIETCVFNHSIHVFNYWTRVFKFVDRHWFTRVHSSFIPAVYIANTLRHLIVHDMFTQVHCVHYLSRSNSPANIRIGKHICKGRELIHLVTGVIGMRVSPSKLFPANLSLGMSVSPHTYH